MAVSYQGCNPSLSPPPFVFSHLFFGDSLIGQILTDMAVCAGATVARRRTQL